MSNEPFPCPFCGSTDVGGAQGIIHCYDCNAKIDVQNTNTYAACEKWNTRSITLSQAKKVIEDAGMVAVPVEPTEPMRESGKSAHYHAEVECTERFEATEFGLRANRASHVYRAMIKAAQKESNSE